MIDSINNQILIGNALTELKRLPSESVQCVVTSPPYWGLRAYGTRPQIWGGRGERLHDWAVESICRSCGAWSGEFGLEPTPAMYVEHSVEIFREVRRILKKNGTLWLNLGDSYAGRGHGYLSEIKGKQATNKGTLFMAERPPAEVLAGLKQKDLVGVPWRVAFALQADGWWLRQDIIWHKPGPMPESVEDRCTKSHEYIFLLSKESVYYCDMKAIAERSVDPESILRGRGKRSSDAINETASEPMAGRNFHSVPVGKLYPTRNRRSVWSINTDSYSESHFAVFPPEIPSLCIQAGSSVGDVVLDPFAGSGTTLQVAQSLGRRYLGIEINPEYLPMMQRRLSQRGLFEYGSNVRS